MQAQKKDKRLYHDDASEHFHVREAVAVFPTEQAFLKAVDDLQEHGFDRSDLSVLADTRHTRDGFSHTFAGADTLADDGNAPRASFITPESLAEGRAAAVALPFYIGSIGGLFIALASGGTLAFTLPLAIAGGLAGGGLGAIGARALGRHHREAIEAQILNGGILLWVRTTSAEKERRAIALLKAASGRNVHMHEMAIRWGIDDVPLAHVNPDPFLEKGPQYR